MEVRRLFLESCIYVGRSFHTNAYAMFLSVFRNDIFVVEIDVIKILLILLVESW